MKKQTITQNYLDLQKSLHEDPNYGVASLYFSSIVAKLYKQTNSSSISDYGAGKKRLLEGLKNEGVTPKLYFPYDPAFPEYGNPQKADLVCCIDVLEHLELEFLEVVLEELSSITDKYGFFSIHSGPAGKILPDGRNAHLIQKPSSWWLPKICKYFNIIHLESHSMMGSGFWIIVKRI